MFRPRFPIETERLSLRPYVEDDMNAHYTIVSRADVARYLRYEPMTKAQARESLRRKMERLRLETEGDALHPAVIRKDTGELIGDVLLRWMSEPRRQGEIGYAFHPDHGGHGFATEAIREMLRLGFEFGLHRITGRVDERNTRSIALLKRLDMQRETYSVEKEYVKGEWRHEVVYALLASTWKP